LEHEEQIKELKMVKERDEYSNKSKNSSHASSSKSHESFGEESLELMSTINHPLGKLERKGKKTQRRLG